MTNHQKTLAKLAPELNPVHMETLAVMVGSTLDGMPHAFFKEVADIASEMGPKRLAQCHKGEH